VVPDAAHMTAMPFIDVAVFNSQPTFRTLFHTLVHVAQFAIVGVGKVMQGYFETLNASGMGMGCAVRGAGLPVGRPVYARS